MIINIKFDCVAQYLYLRFSVFNDSTFSLFIFYLFGEIYGGKYSERNIK